MQRLEVSGAVRLIYRSLGVKGLIAKRTCLCMLSTLHRNVPTATLPCFIQDFVCSRIICLFLICIPTTIPNICTWEMWDIWYSFTNITVHEKLVDNTRHAFIINLCRPSNKISCCFRKVTPRYSNSSNYALLLTSYYVVG